MEEKSKKMVSLQSEIASLQVRNLNMHATFNHFATFLEIITHFWVSMYRQGGL
jgi:hypothetical protein